MNALLTFCPPRRKRGMTWADIEREIEAKEAAKRAAAVDYAAIGAESRPMTHCDVPFQDRVSQRPRTMNDGEWACYKREFPLLAWQEEATAKKARANFTIE